MTEKIHLYCLDGETRYELTLNPITGADLKELKRIFIQRKKSKSKFPEPYVGSNWHGTHIKLDVKDGYFTLELLDGEETVKYIDGIMDIGIEETED